nr:hypothetical protein [Tanacetum cinerariifolium]
MPQGSNFGVSSVRWSFIGQEKIKKLMKKKIIINNTSRYIDCRWSVGGINIRHRVNPINIMASSSKALISNHFQDSVSDVKEENITNNEFMADLNAEYHERALLANQKRFYKRSGREKGDKGKRDKGLVAELFDCDDESVSSEDEGITKFKAFMAITKDEPLVG